MSILKLTFVALICTTFLGLFPDPGHGVVGSIATVAGGGTGDNSAATKASLLYPAGVAVDGAGNLYIADQGNNRIRKVAQGSGVITTVAGNGAGGYSGDNGPATAASLYGPVAVAVDSGGDLYIADRYNNCVRKVSTATGLITTVAGNGTAGFAGDNGAATAASLNDPTGVAVDFDGNIYVADRGNNRIRKVVAETGLITTVAGGGSRGYSGDGGPATEATLNRPFSVAVDAASDLYLSDQGNNRIRKISAGTGIITTFAGNGTAGYSGDNGAAVAAALNRPAGVAVDSAGDLYVGDFANDRIRKVSAGTGIITTCAGSGAKGLSGDKGTATAALLNHPAGVAVDGAGNLYVADQFNYAIRKVLAETGTIVTVAGGRAGSFSGDNGPALAARLDSPERIASDGAGNLYIADSANNRIRRVSATGVISTVAGNGTGKFAGDNGPATAAALYNPSAVALDGAGNLYVADRGNHRVRKVSPAGTISTVAGNGTAGYAGDNGPAIEAALNNPSGIAIDSAGNLYISDRDNHRVRKVAAGTGVVTTVAGSGTAGDSGDNGAANVARLNHPAAVAVDSAGNIFIADEGNHRVRKVAAASGIITTVAGNGKAGYSGDDGPAAMAVLYTPTGVAVDNAGNLYIADQDNFRIRKVSAGNGMISTVTGNGKHVYAGDEGAATAASLAHPSDVALDGAGKLFIADKGNNCIRVVSDDAAKEAEAGREGGGTWSTPADATAGSAATSASAAMSATAIATATTYMYDSFTTSSTVTLNTHTPEIGSTWIRVGGVGYAYVDPTYDAMYTRSDVTYVNTVALPTADYSVIGTIHAFARAGGTNCGVTGRQSPTGAPSRYFAIFTQGLGWGLYYADGYGHETRFGALYGPTSLTAGRDYTVELRMVGSSISMYVDGVLAASGTSTKNAFAGRAGFETSGVGPGVAFHMLDIRVVSAGSSPTTYTLNYSAGAGGTITGATTQTVLSGGSGTQVTAVANTGYRFVSWSDGVTTASRTDTNVTRNISVTASFASSTTTSYTLTYTAGTGGSISGVTKQTVVSGGSGTPVTAVPNTGYRFVSWSDGVATATRTDTNVTRNITVTASFALGTQTNYILDTFTASSTVTLESHTPETGSAWKRIGGAVTDYIDPTWDGVYNRGDATYANLAPIPSADYSVYATIHTFAMAGSTNIGIAGRIGATVHSRYFAIFTQYVGWALYYADGYGNETRIGAVYGPRTLTANRDYKLELRMVGSTISMYVDGVLAATGTNTKIQAAGLAGFELSGAGPGVAFELLDFRVAPPGK